MTRVAIIGAGVAGLGAAWELDRSGRCDVTVFEAEKRIGGHACTVVVDGRHGPQAVDMGFAVHAPRTCPRLVTLLTELDVATRPAEASFSVSCRGCGLEYADRAVGRQLDRFMRPRMVWMVAEARRFRREARAARADPSLDGLTLGDFAMVRGYSPDMVRHYLVPLVGATWSAAPAAPLELPVGVALGMLDHRGLLDAGGHEWRTVVGGSQTYVDAILSRLGGEVRPDSPILAVRRGADGVDVLPAGAAAAERFDHVILATHADTSLALLDDADHLEQELLGSFEFAVDEAVLHHDPAVLPRRRSTVSTWNYRLASCAGPGDVPMRTSSMNRLHGLSTTQQLSVTHDDGGAVDPARELRRHLFSQPRPTHRSVAAQQRLHLLDSRRRTSFCGAWQGYGFHEDGLRSGQRVATALLGRLRDSTEAYRSRR